MADLHDVVTELMRLIAALPGIRKAPIDPPEQMAVFPFAVGYSETGVWKMGPPDTMTGLHNIVIEIHVSREQDLGKAIADALQYSHIVPNAIMNALRTGTLTTFQTFENITYTFGPLGWGGKSTIGFKFVINGVKTQNAIA